MTRRLFVREFKLVDKKVRGWEGVEQHVPWVRGRKSRDVTCWCRSLRLSRS